MNTCEKAYREWVDSARPFPSVWEEWKAAWDASAKVSQEEIASLKAEIERLTTEINAVIDGIPNAVRVRESNGPEEIAASLAVSVSKLVREIDRLKVTPADTRPEPEKFVGCACEGWVKEWKNISNPFEWSYKQHPEKRFCPFCGSPLYRSRKRTVIPFWVTLHRPGGDYIVMVETNKSEAENSKSELDYAGETYAGQFVVYEDEQVEESKP